MKTLFKYKKERLLGICAIIIIYIIISITTNMKIEKIIDTSYDNLGLDNPYTFAISDEKFKRLCVRRGYLPRMEGDPKYTEEYSRTSVKTIHWFFGAISYYTYTYELLEDGRCIHGSWDIPVTIISVFGRVTKVYEVP